MPSTILVVDDNDDIRSALAMALSPVGRVLQARDGPSALAQIEAEEPALVLLDVSMPEMSGLAVLEEAHRLHPSLAIVMITADADLELAKSALNSGARSYVTKPFDCQKLREDVCRILGVEPAPEPYRPWRVNA